MTKKLISFACILFVLPLFWTSCSSSSSGSGVVTHTVTFNSEGGSVIAPVSVEDGASVQTPVAPSKNGYTFADWFLGESETAYDFSTPVTSDITLKAKWSLVEYTITYEGLDETDTNSSSNPSTYTIESDEITLAEAVSDGNVFNGWYKGSEKITSIPTGSYGDITLVAAWKSTSGLKCTVTGESDITVVTADTDSGKKWTAAEGYSSYSWTLNNAQKSSTRELEIRSSDLIENVVYDIYLEAEDSDGNTYSWCGTVKKAVN